MPNGEEQTESSGEQPRASGRRRGAAASKPRTDAPSLGAALGDARQSVEAMVENWREMVDEHPLKAVGLAMGAGYVVGGGLLTTLTGRLLLGAVRIGLRLAALPVVRNELIGLVETASERGRSETERRHQ
jgi:hypothetical protein